MEVLRPSFPVAAMSRRPARWTVCLVERFCAGGVLRFFLSGYFFTQCLNERPDLLAPSDTQFGSLDC